MTCTGSSDNTAGRTMQSNVRTRNELIPPGAQDANAIQTYLDQQLV
jgi:hypothetical protein